MGLTIGVESEAQLWRGLVQADTLKALGGRSKKFANKPFAEITPDAARCSIEFVTGICNNASEVLSDLNFLRSQISNEYQVRFQTTIPVPRGEPHIALANKPRYQALLAAVQREAPDGWTKMYDVAARCSTQVHLGIDPLTTQGIAVMNLFNNIAPYAAVKVREEYGVKDADGHCAIWGEFADARRFPSPRWFTCPDEMQAFVRSIPKMLKQVGDDWVVDLETPSEIGDQDAESTIWFLARPRGKCKTVEVRPFPSLKPIHSAYVAGQVKDIAEAFLHETHGEGLVNPQEAMPAFSKLHKRFYMVPERPLTDRQWKHYFRL